MGFVAGLNLESLAIKAESGSRIVQGDDDVISRGDLDLVQLAAKLIAGVKGDNSIANGFDRLIHQHRVQEGNILLHGHVGNHHLVVVIDRVLFAELA